MLNECMLPDNGTPSVMLSHPARYCKMVLSLACVRSPLCHFCSLRLSLSFCVSSFLSPSLFLSFSFSTTHARHTQGSLSRLSPPPSDYHALSLPTPSLPFRSSVSLCLHSAFSHAHSYTHREVLTLGDSTLFDLTDNCE